MRSLTSFTLIALTLACGSGTELERPTSTTRPGVDSGGASEGPGLETGVEDSDTGPRFDTEPDTDGNGIGCDNADLGCTDKIDLLFVIDNSGSMGEEQLNLAKNFPLLIDKLENLTDSMGNEVKPDVNIMVTTTDFVNPLWDPFRCSDQSFRTESECESNGHKWHAPERGQPVATSCRDRIDRFTSVSEPPVVADAACTQVCPANVTPDNVPFINFNRDADNIPDTVAPVDINGDGVDDSPVAQALACIGPQGIDGNGYESPLENMLQALNPGADWNNGGQPFLRDNALLAVVIITDEADCSVKNFDIMFDQQYMETDPTSSQPRASSAVCWNAGTDCSDNGDGTYDCTSKPETAACIAASAEGTGHKHPECRLQPITRYIDYLVGQLREKDRKEVVMLGILGVPEVTEHATTAPFQPTAGGVFDLVYRDWMQGAFGMGGDILPDDAAANIDADRKQFDFGIGPGCTGYNSTADEYTGQAIPPVRVKEVCEALNIPDDPETERDEAETRCCIESICGQDFSAAINCLTGIISESIIPPG